MEPTDERDVVREPPERTYTEGRCPLEVHPAHTVAAEEVVEVHPKPEKPCGGKPEACLGVNLLQLFLGTAPTCLARQVAVHRRGRGRVEVSAHDEGLLAGHRLDV